MQKHYIYSTLRASAMSMLLATSIVHAETDSPIRLSEPVLKDAYSETFGQKVDTSLPMVELKTLAEEPSKYLSQNFQLETTIAKVCQKKGCFFIAQQNDVVMRVSFKDYGFFIPTDTSGKTVLLAGKLVQKNMSAEQAAHFKDDLKSETDSIKTGVVFEIVADSVKIPRV